MCRDEARRSLSHDPTQMSRSSPAKPRRGAANLGSNCRSSNEARRVQPSTPASTPRNRSVFSERCLNKLRRAELKGSSGPFFCGLSSIVLSCFCWVEFRCDLKCYRKAVKSVILLLHVSSCASLTFGTHRSHLVVRSRNTISCASVCVCCSSGGCGRCQQMLLFI